jgi:cytochrome c553
VQEITYPVTADAAQLREGKKLVVSMCGTCHYDPGTGKLTGKQMNYLPRIAGKVYSRNITQDPAKGIANYTNGQLAYLIRTGIARNGRLMSYMQRPNLADTDLEAIIAFLHSNDPLVTPSAIAPPETHYTAFGKFGVNHFPGTLPYTGTVVTKPDTNDKLAYGRYLVDNLSCYHCHSTSFLTVNELQPEKSRGYMKGGNKLKDSEGKTLRSANITFDETGIGSWTEADFKKAMKEGVNKNGLHLRLPMPQYTELSDHDLASIYAYLGSVPKIKNKVKRK